MRITTGVGLLGPVGISAIKVLFETFTIEIVLEIRKNAADSAVLEVLDSAGKTVRKYSSADKPGPPETDLNVLTYRIRPPQILPAAPGMHRFVWDLHYTPPESPRHDYPMTAVYHNTPRAPRGVIALPGQYTVKLTVDGKIFS